MKPYVTTFNKHNPDVVFPYIDKNKSLLLEEEKN